MATNKTLNGRLKFSLLNMSNECISRASICIYLYLSRREDRNLDNDCYEILSERKIDVYMFIFKGIRDCQDF